MIRGTYLKDCEFTEVKIGNGITQIMPEELSRELKVITFPKRMKKSHRRYEELTIKNAVMLGLASGGTLAAMIFALEYVSGNYLLITMLLAVMLLDISLFIVNMCKKRWK